MKSAGDLQMHLYTNPKCVSTDQILPFAQKRLLRIFSEIDKIRIWEHAAWSWETSTGLTWYITFRLWLSSARDHKEQKQVMNLYIIKTRSGEKPGFFLSRAVL